MNQTIKRKKQESRKYILMRDFVGTFEGVRLKILMGEGCTLMSDGKRYRFAEREGVVPKVWAERVENTPDWFMSVEDFYSPVKQVIS